MNKLFLIIFLIGLFSCNDGSDITITKTEYEKLKGVIPPKTFTVNGQSLTIYTGSDKHDYYQVYPYHSNDIYLHYPECNLCLERNKKDSL